MNSKEHGCGSVGRVPRPPPQPKVGGIVDFRSPTQQLRSSSLGRRLLNKTDSEVSVTPRQRRPVVRTPQ